MCNPVCTMCTTTRKIYFCRERTSLSKKKGVRVGSKGESSVIECSAALDVAETAVVKVTVPNKSDSTSVSCQETRRLHAADAIPVIAPAKPDSSAPKEPDSHTNGDTADDDTISNTDGEEVLLSIIAIEGQSTAENEAKNIIQVLKESNICSSSIAALVFDTTAVNSGHRQGFKVIQCHTQGQGYKVEPNVIIFLSPPGAFRKNVARTTGEEEDELSEVEPDAVPPEVREWLASTFTRQLTNNRRKTDEKPRFRSVANAIRAGIFVERIYRRLSSATFLQLPPDVTRLLKKVDEWHFDVWQLQTTSNNTPLRCLAYELLNRYGLLHKFKVPPAALEAFLTQVEAGYCKYKNPYHNNVHAADVMQTIHYMLSQTGLMNWLTDVEILATLIAALIHDYEHTGTTNNFHVMSGSETALLYNDRAVLENHHVCAAFRLLRGEENNVLVNLSREEYREFRSLVIEMVLATDMSSHFQQIKAMKTMLSLSDSRQAEGLDKAKALSLVLHCCDISHPAKRWDLHEHWTGQLLEEFFRQGDKERDLGLPYSPLCDRNNTLVAESQIGFIDFIVEPSLQVCGDLLEKVAVLSAPSPSTTIVEEPQNATVSVAPSTETILEEEPDNEPGGPIKRPVRSAGAPVPRPWQQCLVTNKARWKDRAAKDAELRALQAQQQAEVNGDESTGEDEEERGQEENPNKAGEKQEQEVNNEGATAQQE
ncbi:unnamed protein product, partial [Meganyctiphanes norvegica]